MSSSNEASASVSIPPPTSSTSSSSMESPSEPPTTLNKDVHLSKNQLKNEAKKKAKLEKFQAKQAKLASTTSSSTTATATATSTTKKPSSKEQPQLLSSTTLPSTITTTGDASTSFDPEVLNHIESKKLLPMPSSYDPKFVEAGWEQWWEKQGCFQPHFDTTSSSSSSSSNDELQCKSNGTFVVPIPPPNVTGTLHLGHALTISIQDTLVRYHRMLGKTVLYNPGCDHAGIATQSVVEKRLWKESKMTRYDLGRDRFLEKVWEWKQTHGDQIYSQLKRLGSSLDWSRAKFTMDPMLTTAVTEAFVQLHQQGVIYRATKLVNWCSYLTTALSNLEVNNKEIQGKTFLSIPGCPSQVMVGVLTYFAYPLKNHPGKEIIVATTRLETMLADVAVAVHPNDPRYQQWIGEPLIHPFFPNRTDFKIIADTYVDPDFGTGAVKITPAHDPNDFELGRRHQLPLINLFNDDGTLNHHAGPFEGQHRFIARTEVLEALQEQGWFRKEEPHTMVVPLCSRSGDIIEPRLKPQWYVKCDQMAQRAMDVVNQDQLEILPKASEKEWFRWLSQIQDWCISRQLWWGHRIPAYFIRLSNLDKDTPQKEQQQQPQPKEEDHEDRSVDPHYWVVARTYEEALVLAKERFPNQAFHLEQDEDVLDTWFSSGLWPFSIFGWPSTSNSDYQHFYPTSLLETGWDILFFWVARMVMLGLQLTNQVPFPKVFCHAMVRDAHGRKMSKSLGNVIDPIDVIQGIGLNELHQRLEQGNLDPKEIEKAKQGQSRDFPKGIPECGADALRFALCAYTSTGRDINLDILRVEGYRKFCNKIWQATKFALLQFGSDFQASFASNDTNSIHQVYTKFIQTKTLGAPELWILNKLHNTIQSLHYHLEHYNFMSATSVLHQFWLYDVCDVFLEICKNKTYQSKFATSWKSTLYLCMDHGLKLLHPFMPFVTEELWQRLPHASSNINQPHSIMLANFPMAFEFINLQPNVIDVIANMELMLEAVKQTRSLVTDYQVKETHVYFSVTSKDLASFFTTNECVFLSFFKSKATMTCIESTSLPPGCVTHTLSPLVTLGLMVQGYVNVTTEIQKLKTKLTKAQTSMDQLKKLHANEDYLTKVKDEVKQNDELKLQKLNTEIDQLSKCLENFLNLQTE